MKLWKCLLSPAVTLCLVVPGALYADEEAPDVIDGAVSSFQNPTQAKRAENIASELWSDQDDLDAKDQAEGAADDHVDEIATAYAEGVVDKISRDYADQVVDEKATAYADQFVEQKAIDYADSVADKLNNAADWQTAYDTAYARATGGISHEGGGDWEDAWQTAYNSAVARATGGVTSGNDWEDAWQTAYDSAYARATGGVTSGGDWEDAYQTAYNYAVTRATGGVTSGNDWEDAYHTAYEKALAEAIAGIRQQHYDDVVKLRLVDGYGWGQIAKYLELHPSINGMGHMKMKQKGFRGPDDVFAPAEPEAIPLEDEIAEATRRDTRSGWNDAAGFNAKSNKGKGSKKEYGLTQTSGVASSDVSGNNAAKMNKSKSKSKNKNQSSYSTQTSTSTSSQAAQGGSPGLGSSKAKNSNGGGSSKKGGKSGDKDSKGNNGKNGNNAGGKKK